jgi:methylisocitrate lyase
MPNKINRSTSGAKFRHAVKAEAPLQVVGTINAYTAKMAERVGYQAVYLSGGGVAANSLGVPDLGISTLHDVLIDAERICNATSLPLLVDIDTGWGGAFNIARAIRSMERVGVAAVHIEDQVGSKRCGHRPGKELVSQNEMVDRIKSAVDARLDTDFVIIARTDALAGEGLDAATERASAYVEAGADMVFVEEATALDIYRHFKEMLHVPIVANLTEFGSTPMFTVDELRHAGVDIALYCCGAYRMMNAAALNFYETVRTKGTQQSIVPSMQSRVSLYDFLGYHDYEKKLDALFAINKSEK